MESLLELLHTVRNLALQRGFVVRVLWYSGCKLQPFKRLNHGMPKKKAENYSDEDGLHRTPVSWEVTTVRVRFHDVNASPVPGMFSAS